MPKAEWNHATHLNRAWWTIFSLQIAIIYQIFTVVTLTAPLYSVRNVGIHIEFYYIINVDLY